MIYSFSHRTDGPAFYWDWFLNRLSDGYALVRNPHYPEKVSRYDLDPSICEGFTFTSKNYAPVLGDIRALQDLVATYPTLWSATINGYDAFVEPGVPDTSDAIRAVRELSNIVTPERLTWMYSPVALDDTRGIDLDYHQAWFEHIARSLAGSVVRVSVDTLRVYYKVSRNAPTLREPHKWEEDVLIESFARTAEKYGMELHACPAHHHWKKFGVSAEPCMSLQRFGRINDCDIRKLKFAEGSGLYDDCVEGCMPVRDLAPYNSCPHNCAYCYANAKPGVADMHAEHYVPTSPMLLDTLGPNDIVSCAKPRLYLRR